MAEPLKTVGAMATGTEASSPARPRANPSSHITDPIALPRAISGLPLNAAIMETESSGAVVAKETRTMPITSLGILNLSARLTALSTKISALLNRKTKDSSTQENFINSETKIENKGYTSGY